MSAFVQESDLGTVPWDLLDTVSLRRKLLVNPEAFSHVKTLDPMWMSPHDVYIVLALLLKGQDSGVRLLEFSMGDIYNSDMDGERETNKVPEPDLPTASPRDMGISSATAELANDISELSDLPIQLLPSPAIRTADSKTCAASTRDKSVYSDGMGLQLLDPPLPLLSAPVSRVASPVIDPPTHPSPPLSKSTIKAAIENVAKAGYLSISDTSAIDSPNQAHQPLKTASQQSGKAKTSSSNSKKRGREEQGSPNENKKMKKQAVPTCEQSSQYDIPNIFLVALLDISFIASRTPTIRTCTSLSAPVRFVINNRQCVGHVVGPLVVVVILKEQTSPGTWPYSLQVVRPSLLFTDFVFMFLYQASPLLGNNTAGG